MSLALLRRLHLGAVGAPGLKSIRAVSINTRLMDATSQIKSPLGWRSLIYSSNGAQPLRR